MNKLNGKIVIDKEGKIDEGVIKEIIASVLGKDVEEKPINDFIDTLSKFISDSGVVISSVENLKRQKFQEWLIEGIFGGSVDSWEQAKKEINALRNELARDKEPSNDLDDTSANKLKTCFDELIKLKKEIVKAGENTSLTLVSELVSVITDIRGLTETIKSTVGDSDHSARIEKDIAKLRRDYILGAKDAPRTGKELEQRLTLCAWKKTAMRR